MKLLTVYSQQFEPLYSRFFEPTLRATNPEIEIVAQTFTVDGNGDFRSPGFNQSLIYKWKRGLEFLYQNDGQVVLFTDVDLIFNKPLVSVVLSVLGDADIAASPENPGGSNGRGGINVGFLAFRCNEGVRSFVSQLLDEMILRREWDQGGFNRLLPQSLLQYRILPDSFSNGKIPYDRASIVYHATRTKPRNGVGSVELKAEALKAAQAVFGSGDL